MAVYVKFKSAKDFFSIPVTSTYTSVSELKSLIYHSNKYGHGKDFDITVTNPLTNEDYSVGALILKNSTVLVRRIPGVPPPRIVIKSKEEEEKEKAEAQKALSSSILNNETVVNSQSQGVSNVIGGGRSTMSGSGCGPIGQGICLAPPEGYVCHRCRVPGHFIQHCPTNGDPEYDIKRLRPPTGIPKSMLMVNADGSYALSGGAVAVMKPNEVASDKEVESISIPSASRRVVNFPPELYCPLCKEVMKDAVLTRKCCFQSFCNECIRGNIFSKSMCICGATNMAVDDLIPNKTLRDTINSYLKSSDSSAGNTKSTLTTEDTGSALSLPPKIPAPANCGVSKTEKIPSSVKEEIFDAKEIVNERNPVGLLQQSLEKGKSEDEAHSSIQKESSSASLVQEEVQESAPPCELGNKKKRKKNFSSLGSKPVADGDLFWGTSEAIADANYMGPFSTSANNNPCWGMQLGMEGYMAPYNYYYGYNYAGAPYGGMCIQNPFGGDQGSYAPCQSREHVKDLELSKEVRRSAYHSSIKSNEAQKRQMIKNSHSNENIGQHVSRTKSSSQGKRSRATPDRCDYSSDVDNGDDERNFKRKRSWYESSSSSQIRKQSYMK